ncbi:MAG: hypothetical protein E6H57_15465 [Betaproteobacteria bacterium]|nr:MAG: hypothetical protein E6H57_15465 [Betaproteobacteria bacterium]
MKATIALILVSSTALVACTRIIERPAPASAAPSVVSTPAIVERTTQAPAPATGATAPAACTWASQSYSSGATSCQDHAQYRCNAGTWEKIVSAPSC